MEKKDKLLTTEQVSKQLHILPKTPNNPKSTGTGILIAQNGEIRGLLEMLASTENNTLTHTGEARGLLDAASSSENNSLTRTGEVKGLLD